MSVYTRDEINKKILEISRGSDSCYSEKKRQFLDGVDRYKELNKIALCSNKIKLDVNSNDVLRYGTDCTCEVPKKCDRCCESDGLLLQKRTVRYIHDDTFDKIKVCMLEPWFGRYLKLCKFIEAARGIILKRRLLNNLRILRTWDENSVQALENQQRRIENVSYADLFERFIE